MKRIIGGKLYDTGKATQIYSNFPIVLFKTDNGSYLYMYMDKEMAKKNTEPILKVLSEERVKRILGERDVDTYITLFGMPEEG